MARLTDSEKIDFLLCYVDNKGDMKEIRAALGGMPRTTVISRLQAIKKESAERKAAETGGGDKKAEKTGGKRKAAAALPKKAVPAKKKAKVEKVEVEGTGGGQGHENGRHGSENGQVRSSTILRLACD